MSAARGASALGRAVPRQPLGSVVAGVCAVALLGGCTSSAEPTPLPKPTASTSPSPSASATPPTLPSEAEGTSPRAAKAFARHYVASVNYAMASGDTAQLAGLSTNYCATCAALTDRISSVYAQGGKFEGGIWFIRAAEYTPLDGEKALVLMSLDIRAQRITERDGAAPSSDPGSRGSLELRLSRRADAWVVTQMDAR